MTVIGLRKKVTKNFSQSDAGQAPAVMRRRGHKPAQPKKKGYIKMIYTLMIDTASDAAFAFVVMLYGAVILAAMCIITAIVEGIVKAIERAQERKRRRNRCRNYYDNF